MLEKINTYGFILIACIIFFFLTTSMPKWGVEHTLSVLLQVLYWAGSSYLAYRKGESDAIRDIRRQARDRYRRLSTLLKMMIELAEEMKEKESNFSHGSLYNSSDDLQENRMFLKEIYRLIYSWVMNLKDCLAFWEDLAPSEVEELHKNLFGRDKE